jgi:hypothetical protein
VSLLLVACGSPGSPPSTDDDDGALVAGDAMAAPAATLDTSTIPSERLPGEPDPSLTPGWLNPAVSQDTIYKTVCVSGWTTQIRPSSGLTNRLKAIQIIAYGYADTSPGTYEEDHLIPLQLGGHPTDPRNLWPEPYFLTMTDGRPAGAKVKDPYETALKRQVCAGELSLADAQARIGASWVHAYYQIRFPPASPAP